MNDNTDVPGVTGTAEAPIVIASVAREQGITGVHTHVRQLRRYGDRVGRATVLVTPHSWTRGRPWRRLLLVPLFGVRILLERLWGPAHVWWYRTSHEHILRMALRHRLIGLGACTVYAQCPVSARAALAARTGPHQRVVMAVHFRISQADEWADKGQIAPGGRVYRWVRRTERAVVPRVDALVFVSEWARHALRSWLPEVNRVPGVVIPNFISSPAGRRAVGAGDVAAPRDAAAGDAAAGDAAALAGHLVSVGNLEAVKNHRYLLQVLAAARRKGYLYRLDVFGEGVERPRLLSLASELGVAGQLRLHGFCADAQERLPQYSAYVHASYSESSSLAIIEAMAAGLPVLSTADCALSGLFSDPEEGRFWPGDDPEEAARILIDLLESPAELSRLGRAARRKFLETYDAELVGPRLLRLLDGEAP